jgi:hypothetical protein
MVKLVIAAAFAVAPAYPMPRARAWFSESDWQDRRFDA